MSFYLKESPIDLSKVTAIVNEIINSKSYTVREPYHLEAREWFKKDPSGQTIPESIMTKDQALEFAERLRRSEELYGKRCKFNHYDISKEATQEIINLLPNSIKNQNIVLTLQHAGDGDYLLLHTDHLRKSSFFVVLSEPDMETRFYKKIVDFTEYDFLKYANPDHLEEVYRLVMEKDVWYLFNQLEFHSAHEIKDTVDRFTFCIEFPDLTAEQVLALL